MNFDIRWRSASHEQIWQWAQAGGGPRSSTGAEQALASMHRSLADSVGAVTRTLESAGAVWRGPAAARATAFMQALRQYTDWLAFTSDGSRASTMDQAGAAAWVRKAMPPVAEAGPPPALPSGTVLDVLKQTQDWQAREAAARNAERIAQEIMEQHTKQTRERIDSLPVLVPMPRIVLNTGIAPPPTPPAPPGPPPVPPRLRDSGTRGGGSVGDSGGGGVEQRRPETRPGEFVEGRPVEGAQSPHPGQIPADRTELVWNRGAEHGTSTGGGLGGGFSAGGGGVGGGGLVGGGGGVGVPAPQSPPGGNTGRGGTGTPAGSAPPRSAGTPGQQGFLQPASGAQRAEDSEHQRKYWVPGSDLFEDDRLVAPPVIGED